MRASVCVWREVLMGYSEEFKEALVSRMVGKDALSANALSEESGVSQGTLSRWLRNFGEDMKVSSKKRGAGFSGAEKFKILLETVGLREAELGEYLRRRGLHSVEVERWREEATRALQGEKRGRPKIDPEVQQLRKERHELRRDLRKKEKALAEASALLIMKKKAELIWGVSEDDESD